MRFHFRAGNGIFVVGPHICEAITFKEKKIMAGKSGSKGGGSTPRGDKGGAGFTPSRPGGNKPSMTGNPSGTGRGNLPAKSSGK